VEINGEQLDVNGLYDWDAQWRPTEPGAYRLEATVEDETGATNTAARSLDVTERTLPQVTIDQPTTDAAITAGDEITIQGTASEGDAALADVSVAVNGTRLATDGQQTWQAGWTPTTWGPQRIEVNVTDVDGLMGTANREVTVARPDPPSVTITAPAASAAVQVGDEVPIASELEEGHNPIETLVLFAGDRRVGTWQPGEPVTWTPNQDGELTLKLVVEDTIGVEGTETVTLTVDPPDAPSPDVTLSADTVEPGTTVDLDASRSTSPQG
jgi:chitinase